MSIKTKLPKSAYGVYLLSLLLIPVFSLSAADLSGNWVVRDSLPDGTVRRSYFDLKQEGAHITGHIRTTQAFYIISESTGGPDTFTLVGTWPDGDNQRKATYQISLVGDELHVSTRRRPDAPLIEMVAHRTTPGEGALPTRLPLPALHKVPYNGLAKTPPMGWNSWNKFASRVDDAAVRGAADALVSTGMKDAGFIYVNIDDTWEADRDAQGNIQTNKKFPDMKALADYVHGKGLKLGIYSSPGPNTCAGYEGSFGHEEQDAKTYAAWGIDYLKYDWCGARNLYKDSEMQPLYQKMGDALQATGRAIVYSLCQYGRADVWKWGPDVGGNLWRTTGDIRDSYDSMEKIGFSQNDLAPYAAPGHWNDPDMLEVGNGGMSTVEYQTHMTLWSILAAPLLAGNDLQNMSPEILAILTNREVIAIDQDRAGKQGARAIKSGDTEVWTRDLINGGRAVAIFNRGTSEAVASFHWSDVGFRNKIPAKARNVWLHQDVAVSGVDYSTTVPGHGVVLLVFSARKM